MATETKEALIRQVGVLTEEIQSLKKEIREFEHEAELVRADRRDREIEIDTATWELKKRIAVAREDRDALLRHCGLTDQQWAAMGNTSYTDFEVCDD